MVNYLVLLTALSLSGVSAYYSIIGLTAVFAGSFWPVVIMGSTLEFAKIISTSWLYRNWKTSPFLLKTYLTFAIIILMTISSMGIFGFLSKAHIDQNLQLTTGDADQIKIIQSKIDTEQSTIDDLNKQISQIDAAVTKMTDKGQAQSSLQAADKQRKQRDDLTKQKTQHVETISNLKTEKIKLESNVKKTEAEVGPIKYIASAIYGSSGPDTLELAVRWVILLLVVVFDPLAIVLLLAANHGINNNKKTLPEIPKDNILVIDSDKVLQPTKENLLGYIMSLINRLIKNSTIKDTSLLTESKIYGKKDIITTSVPMVNVALSGSVDGGLTPGLTVLAGPSKHFKSAFSLLMASAYMKQYPDSVLIFYDSEFGTPQTYFESFGIDMQRVIHTPITDIEELKFDIMKQLNEIARNEKVVIVIDSVGNLASKKEVEDAANEKSVADMSRAKSLKSLFRMVTPHLTLKDIPLIVVNHTYKEIGLYPKDIVGGGTGIYYSADTIWILGRQQDKDADGIQGYHFIINVEKSRYVKEKSKIPITVSFEGGIKRWSGMLDLAIEGGYVVKPSNGWYQLVDRTTGEVSGTKMRAADIEGNSAIWKQILSTTDFADWIKKKYTLASGSLVHHDDDIPEIDDE
jgi:RecA/RadA recombinase